MTVLRVNLFNIVYEGVEKVDILVEFEKYLVENDKSKNTIDTYLLNVKSFLKWFSESKDVPFSKLHRENFKEYISFIKTVKKYKPKTINTKINALVQFNEFLVETGKQTSMVITKRDYEKIQEQYASLAKFGEKEIEKLRQLVLESENKRNYALVTILAYAGLRLSEALNLRMDDVNFASREMIIRGKGSKIRTVYMGKKVREALKSYLRVRNNTDCEYLFYSNRGKKLNRTTVNKLFDRYSVWLGVEIAPHDLRHFFCSHALESGMSIHEVANQAGHSNIHTTMLYTNPSRQEIISKMDQL